LLYVKATKEAQISTTYLSQRYPAPSQAHCKVRVLLVDDSQDLRELYEKALTLRGYEVTQASDGLEAVELIQNAVLPPDVIVLDLEMPLMDGLQFLHKRRQLGFNIPVVIYSAKTDDFPAGVPALRKPARLDDLVQTIEAARSSIR
jgi:two-component system response regulator MprA